MERWGLDFFRINADGHVTVHPSPDDDRGLDLYQLAMDLSEQGVGLPLLLRFSDVLRSRIGAIADAFGQAIQDFEYGGGYTAVYPIKVNQQRHVVQEVVEFGDPYHVGLECGSKAELQAILGLSGRTDHLIVCNGYKDEEYLRLALMGKRLGHQVFVVLEQLSELTPLLAVADELGVTPSMGVRIKLATEGSGRWAKSGGERSKFGLNPAQLVKLLDRLKSEGREDLLRLVHFHLGSQITDIRIIKSGLEEIARYYSELRQMGFPISHVDVGGGLGVDYDGSRSTQPTSINYSIQEYANDIVFTLREACRVRNLPMPDIISESGRALTAHHSLLLVNVIDVETQLVPERPAVAPEAHPLLKDMAANLAAVDVERVIEVYHDAVYAKERARELFDTGVLTLRDLAHVDLLYLATLNAVAEVIGADPSYPEIQRHIEAVLVDRYFCNFSVFQSLPDSWAIQQVFPIMPVHRLGERPSRRATLHDITCDSDGVIERFAGGRLGSPSLPLHPLADEGEPYILGIFLTGAYQEILGDLHNLFGDTNAVHVRIVDGGYEITDLVHGDTVTEVLNYVQFHASDLLATFRRKVNGAPGLTRQEANSFIADYVAGLEGYTYLEGG